jgi:hypothetical protein
LELTGFVVHPVFITGSHPPDVEFHLAMKRSSREPGSFREVSDGCEQDDDRGSPRSERSHGFGKRNHSGVRIEIDIIYRKY